LHERITGTPAKPEGSGDSFAERLEAVLPND
jgi:hypothetical protein